MLSTNFKLFRGLYILLPVETTSFVHFVTAQFLSELLTQPTIMNTFILQYAALLLVHLTNLDYVQIERILHHKIHINLPQRKTTFQEIR